LADQSGRKKVGAKFGQCIDLARFRDDGPDGVIGGKVPVDL
jgi:hypothetical protein